MGITTGIDWCDSTANPLVGCDGCELENCYARGLVNRYAGLPGWPAAFDRPKLFPERFREALRWPDLTGKERPGKPWLNGKPRHIFWCDLADPFTASVPWDWLEPYLPALDNSPHVHIFCTKRPETAAWFFGEHPAPKNLILLTTVTSDRTLWRAEELLRVPGISVRGVSYEPALGPVDFTDINRNGDSLNALTGGVCSEVSGCICEEGLSLDWLIAGGESGPGARPMHPEWARKQRDDCQAAGVPFFFKQWGEWA